MVILYNHSILPLNEKPYKEYHDKKVFSSKPHVRPLTRKNKIFLQSLGLKVLV